jgi:DNA repair photolyase
VRSILAGNDSPDIGFDLSINPYRGCEHGCIYCYARPDAQLPEPVAGARFRDPHRGQGQRGRALREALGARGYTPGLLNIGSVTDAYQPAERRLRITRSVIEVLAEAQHPFSIITKSSLVERDLDLIAPMAAAALAAVYRLDHHAGPALARKLEPRACSPQRRLRTIEALAARVCRWA